MTASLNRKAALFAVLLAGAAFIAVPVYAGKTDMQTLNVAPSKQADQPQKDVKVDYRALESAGLYVSADEGSLGKDLWKGTKRSALLRLMENMPVATQQPDAQRLVFGALLSRTDAGLIDNDVPPTPGNDLLTLRLEKLIQAGAYRQAQDLYSSFGDTEPYHERLARAGILAMLLNSEKSLACVEANTVKEKFPESEFIQQILAFCDVTLSDSPSENSAGIIAAMDLKNASILTTKAGAIKYSPESFGSLPLIERAFLAAEKKIDFDGAAVKIENIPPQDIRILIESADLSEENRFLLTAAAQSWGLALPGELKDVYKGALPPAGGDPSKLQVPDTAAPWEKIALYHTIAANTDDDATQWDAIKKGLDQGNRYGIAALAPYSDLLLKAYPADASEEEIETAVRIITASGRPLSSQWIDRIKNIPLDTEKNHIDQRLFALQAVADLSRGNSPKMAENGVLPYPKDSRGGYLVKSIIENVDNKQGDSDNADRIYEKDYGLTFKQDYVMPSTVVWNHLQEVGQRGETGETVLLSASVLQAADLGKIYPGLLDDVRTGLDNVGLTDISSSLARAAVLGSVQEAN